MDIVWQLLLAFGVPSTIFTTIVTAHQKAGEPGAGTRKTRESEGRARERTRGAET